MGKDSSVVDGVSRGRIVEHALEVLDSSIDGLIAEGIIGGEIHHWQDEVKIVNGIKDKLRPLLGITPEQWEAAIRDMEES